MEDAHLGEAIEGGLGLGLGERGTVRRGIDVAAGAARRAAARDDQVDLSWGGERPRIQPGVFFLPQRALREAERARVVAVDIGQPARAVHRDDAAEALGTVLWLEALPHLMAPGCPPVSRCFQSRSDVETISVKAVTAIEPKSRKLTSTPSELEFGL
jgi:hypothetical protein